MELVFSILVIGNKKFNSPIGTNNIQSLNFNFSTGINRYGIIDNNNLNISTYKHSVQFNNFNTRNFEGSKSLNKSLINDDQNYVEDIVKNKRFIRLNKMKQDSLKQINKLNEEQELLNRQKNFSSCHSMNSSFIFSKTPLLLRSVKYL